MRLFKLYIAAFLILGAISGFSQEFEEDMSVDGKYTPPENSVFHLDKKSTSSVTDYTLYNNQVKWNITALARGAFAFEYERVLFAGLSAQGSVGFTVYPDYIKSFFSDFLDTESDRFPSSNGLGMFYGLEGKVNFDYAFDGVFLAFGFRNFSYQNKFNLLSDEIYHLPYIEYSEQNRDFYMSYGITSYLSDHMVGEFSISTGLRMIRSYSVESQSVSNPVTGESYRIPVISPNDGVTFTFFMSYKLGFAFGE